MSITRVSVYLGTTAERCNADNDSVSSKSLIAKSAQDFVALRTGFPQASLEVLNVVVAERELDTLYDPMELSGWIRALRPDANVSITVKIQDGETTAVQGDFQRIQTSFLLAGLVVTSERREADGSRTWTATRKSSQIKSSAPINIKEKAVQIKLNNLDDDDEEDGFIDEDDLLKDENGLISPPSMQPRTTMAGDDCGGRKACDNCTCGRAEQEELNGNNPAQDHDHSHDHDDSNAPKSSCGKCSLGDAFRCASCPYLGLPAFKPGEEHLVLQLKDDL